MGIKSIKTDIRGCKKRIRNCYRAKSNSSEVRFGYEEILAHETRRLEILKSHLINVQTDYCYRCGGVVSVPKGAKEPHEDEKCSCVQMGFESHKPQPESNSRSPK